MNNKSHDTQAHDEEWEAVKKDDGLFCYDVFGIQRVKYNHQTTPNLMKLQN